MKQICYAAALALLPAAAAEAQDKSFTLAAPPALLESGLLEYILPRFSLKTRTRITRVEEGTADAAFGDTGITAFEGPDRVWHFDPGADPDARAFADWLRSDVGRDTVDSYAPDGTPLFTSEVTTQQAVAEIRFDGDVPRGEEASLTHCGRCHVISDRNRMSSIGSTPSFAVLRTLRDWQDRFQAFYVLNPHPAFTQIAEVTPPFDPTRPPPIHAVQMTLEDLENILAFVQGIAPADLGRTMEAISD